MSPVAAEMVRRKLETIVTSLRLLSPIAALNDEAYASDVYRRKATERILQELVEAAVDINAHVLVHAGRPAPDDLYGSFIALGELGVLTRDLALELAPSAGLRNRLVHQYDRIDDSIVLRATRVALALYPRYVAAIEGHVEAERGPSRS